MLLLDAAHRGEMSRPAYLTHSNRIFHTTANINCSHRRRIAVFVDPVDRISEYPLQTCSVYVYVIALNIARALSLNNIQKQLLYRRFSYIAGSFHWYTSRKYYFRFPRLKHVQLFINNSSNREI